MTKQKEFYHFCEEMDETEKTRRVGMRTGSGWNGFEAQTRSFSATGRGPNPSAKLRIIRARHFPRGTSGTTRTTTCKASRHDKYSHLGAFPETIEHSKKQQHSSGRRRTQRSVRPDHEQPQRRAGCAHTIPTNTLRRNAPQQEGNVPQPDPSTDAAQQARNSTEKVTDTP